MTISCQFEGTPVNSSCKTTWDNGEDFGDGPWAEGWDYRCGRTFKDTSVYILVVEDNNNNRNEYVGCTWNGTDFCPIKILFIGDIIIKKGEAINNRVNILSIREM